MKLRAVAHNSEVPSIKWTPTLSIPGDRKICDKLLGAVNAAEVVIGVEAPDGFRHYQVTNANLNHIEQATALYILALRLMDDPMQVLPSSLWLQVTDQSTDPIVICEQTISLSFPIQVFLRTAQFDVEQSDSYEVVVVTRFKAIMAFHELCAEGAKRIKNG